MRIWHKDLIHVLPTQQLVGQWRELSAMAKSIKENGTPNHILVNRAWADFPPEHFTTYTKLIRQEMLDRGYRPAQKIYEDIISVSPHGEKYAVGFDELFEGWHNNKYLEICLRNLEEKAMCGGIKYADEWYAIALKYNGTFDLWEE